MIAYIKGDKRIYFFGKERMQRGSSLYEINLPDNLYHQTKIGGCERVAIFIWLLEEETTITSKLVFNGNSAAEKVCIDPANP